MSGEFHFSISQPHIDSFNRHLQQSLPLAIASIPHKNLVAPTPSNGEVRLSLRASHYEFGYPINAEASGSKKKITPKECRELGISYAGAMRFGFEFQIDRKKIMILKSIGRVPVMIRSFRWDHLIFNLMLTTNSCVLADAICQI